MDAPRISIDSEDDLAEERLKEKSKLVQVADIQFGRFFKRDELLMQLQTAQKVIKRCKNDIEKSTSNPRKAMYAQERDVAQEKFDKLKAEYEGEVLKQRKAKAGTKIADKDFIEDIQYVWVTFTDNDIQKKILKLFRKESQLKKTFRFICCKKSRVREVTNFSEQELDVDEPVEPDQIIWDNLRYSFTHQNRFCCLMIVASIVMMFVCYYATVVLLALEERTSPMDCSRFPEISDE